MRRSLYLAVALLFVATLVFLTAKVLHTASIAEAGSAGATWGAIKDGDGDGTAKAAPARFRRRAARRAQSQDWAEILAEIGNSLDAGLRDQLRVAAPAVTVGFKDSLGNPITEITRGSMVAVAGTHPTNPVMPSPESPYRGVCLLVLPVNDEIHTKEVMLHVREYVGPGPVLGAPYAFFVPPWEWIEGEAIAIVKVDGVGAGFGMLTVLP